MDLLDELAERPTGLRPDAVAHMLTYILDNRDLLGREFFPDEVVAAAAVVAAAMPGGEYLQRLLATAGHDPQNLIPPAPASGLAALAVEALLFVAGPDGPWHQGWTDQATRAEAQTTTDNLLAVLQATNAS
jgi:alpha-glucosidase